MKVLSLVVCILLSISCVEAPTPWVPDGRGVDVAADGRIAGDVTGLDSVSQEAIEETDTPVVCQPDCTGLACAQDDGCGGFCYELLSCDDGADCTIDLCVPEGGGCVHVADHAACDDGDQCTTGLCEEGIGCTVVPLDGACNDSDLCTTNDLCSEAGCAGTPVAEDACADANPCTADQCEPATGCVHAPADGECQVADGALAGECQLGVCVPLVVLQAPCAEDASCAVFASNDLCSGVFTCGAESLCQLDVDSVTQCDDAEDSPCSKNRCDPATGECKMSPEADGLPCEDGDSCTLDDVCAEGECGAGDAAVLCDDLNPCTVDSCLPELGCLHEAVPGSCDDNNPCTQSDACAEGYCVGAPYSCDDGLACTTDVCLGDGTCQPQQPDEACSWSMRSASSTALMTLTTGALSVTLLPMQPIWSMSFSAPNARPKTLRGRASWGNARTLLVFLVTSRVTVPWTTAAK